MKNNPSSAAEQAAINGYGITQSASHPHIDTEPFKKWFGDSKVVDEQDRPLVVYHGTMYGGEVDDGLGFSEFDVGDDASFGAGIYFGSLEDASSYAPEQSPDEDEVAPSRLYPVFLSLQNPIEVSVGTHTGWGVNVVRALPKKIADQFGLDPLEDGDYADNMKDAVQAAGYDGIIVTYEDGQKEYVAYRSSQIKSAIGNNGKFDPANNSITDQGELPAVAAYPGDLATPQTSRVQEKNNWQAWFGNSKIVDDQGKALAVYRGSRSDEGADIGRYFTDSREIASSFSGATKTQVQGVVYPVYLSMQNPCLLQTGDTKIGLEKRALAKGHDGWIAEYRGVREFYIFSANQARSAIGKNADFNLLEKDIEKSADQPQTKTEPFKKWFGSSKVLDEESQPLVLFHSTYSDFAVPIVNFVQDEWKRFGMHVGSLEAATSRLDLKDREDRSSGERSGNVGANIMPVYINIKNPLRLTENRSGRWGVDDIFGAIVKQAEAGDPALNWISPEFIDDFYSDANVLDGINEDSDSDPDADAKIWQNPGDWDAGQRSQALVEWLATAGIDGIVYKNEFEGGGDSYIIFNTAQIKSAIGNSGLYLRDSSSLTDHGAVLTLANAASAKAHIDEVFSRKAGSTAKGVMP